MDSVQSSMSVVLTLFSALLALIAVKCILSWWLLPPNRLPYPPGPKPKPIVGNMFDFPRANFAMTYYNWEKRYDSSILHASALGRHVMILNSLEDVEELFEKRASNYSDRPQTPMLKLMGLDTNIGLMPYGPTWRQHRRIVQQNFRLDTMSAHEPIQTRRVHLMLRGLLEDPDSAFTQHKVLAMSIPLEFMYGYDVKSLDDPYITESQKIEDSLKYLSPEGTLINIFPVLGRIPTWVPGTTAQKAAAMTKSVINKLETEPMETIQKDMDNGVAIPSVISDFIEAKRGTPAFEKDAAIVSQVALTIFTGSGDTLTSALGALFYVLATRPDIQKKGQAEIDRIIGKERLPDFSDRASLPYTDALYRELLRFYPPAPMALPHCSREDDTYKGYFIPKGTVIFPNVWAMTRNEKLYPDAHEFKPERFIDEHGQVMSDSRVLVYGFGRRICIGKYTASSTLWFTIVSVLACFNISKAKDPQGNDIQIPDEFVYHTFTSHKTPFKCSITPRSDVVQRLLDETIAAERLPS